MACIISSMNIHRSSPKGEGFPPSPKETINRKRAIRLRCLDCSAFDTAEVRRCRFSDCPLYPFRLPSGKQDPKKRNRAIKAYCFWCANRQRNEVVLCPNARCPLFTFRPYVRDTPSLPSSVHIEAISGDKMRDEGSYTTLKDEGQKEAVGGVIGGTDSP